MYIDRTFLKQNAKQAIAESRFKILFVAMVFLLLMYALNLFAQNLSGYAEFAARYTEKLMEGETILRFSWPQVEPYAWVLVLCIILMRILMRAGCTSYFLLSSRREPAGFKNLLDGFYFPVKVAVMEVLKYAVILCGAVFFLFPGILFFYMFRLSLFVLFDNPEMGPVGCLGESARLMSGRKWELFLLDLSFAGWYIFSYFFALTGYPVLDVWVYPYTGLTYAGYYNSLIGWQPGQTPPDPADTGWR